jgi:ribosomal-protein-alanine N-acetyltransferase
MILQNRISCLGRQAVAEQVVSCCCTCRRPRARACLLCLRRYFEVDCSSPFVTDLSIELASCADREWCAQLMSSSEPWITLGRDFAACLASCHRPEIVVLVARRAGARCGLVLLHPTGVAGSPYITSIATTTDVRGQGVGSALLDASEKWFPGARHMFLCVSSFNPRARQFYERHGYTKVGEFADYLIVGASEILMHKQLVRP